MDYEQLKTEVQEIAQIAGSVPEQFQQRCFELLLGALLKRDSGSTQPDDKGKGESSGGEDVKSQNDQNSKDKGGLPLNATTRAWMRRVNVTEDDLKAVLFVESDEVHWVLEPTTTKNATAQKEWALLLALRNSLLDNAMTVDAETVRSMLQDKGYYDRTNFASNFKKETTAALFKAVLEPQGSAQGLTNEGQQELGKLIKALAGSRREK